MSYGLIMLNKLIKQQLNHLNYSMQLINAIEKIHPILQDAHKKQKHKIGQIALILVQQI